IVPSTTGTATIVFLASSMPLRIASGTSLALPSPNPTWPLLSPTTTRALKLKRRPPFTTLATRLMWTTFSLSSVPSASVMMRRGPPPLRSAIYPHAKAPMSELETALTRAVRDRTDAAVEQEPVAVKDDPLDALLEAAPRGEQPHLLGGAHVGGLLQLSLQLGRQGGDGEQRAARRIRDHLRVHVSPAAEHRQPGPLLGSPHAPPHALPPPRAGRRLRVGRHQRAAPAAALPALRRSRSSAYLTPFPLYGSGGRSRRMAAATCPSSSRSAPSSVPPT